MNNKLVIIISSIAVIVVLGSVSWMVVDSKHDSPQQVMLSEAPRSSTNNVPAEPKCESIHEAERSVKLMLEGGGVDKKGKSTFRLLVDSSYPVNVVKAAIVYDPKTWTFLSDEYGASAFTIQAPGEKTNGRIIASRGIPGKGSGTVGVVEFGSFQFEQKNVGTNTGLVNPHISLSESRVFLNNDCGFQATIVAP